MHEVSAVSPAAVEYRPAVHVMQLFALLFFFHDPAEHPAASLQSRLLSRLPAVAVTGVVFPLAHRAHWLAAVTPVLVV